jgi:transcriptional regulator GlxA family with amidase domain
VASVRVDEARRLLETSHLAIDRVAEAAGFGSVGALRHHFRRRVRLTPSEYRERFGQA